MESRQLLDHGLRISDDLVDHEPTRAAARGHDHHLWCASAVPGVRKTSRRLMKGTRLPRISRKLRPRVDVIALARQFDASSTAESGIA